jgi:hypothetical protein
MVLEPVYGRHNMPLLRSWDSLPGDILQICRRYAAGGVREFRQGSVSGTDFSL